MRPNAPGAPHRIGQGGPRRRGWRAQRGSISVELAVITAMILVVAVVLLVAIQHFVRGAANQIKGTTP